MTGQDGVNILLLQSWSSTYTFDPASNVIEMQEAMLDDCRNVQRQSRLGDHNSFAYERVSQGFQARIGHLLSNEATYPKPLLHSLELRGVNFGCFEK